MAIHGDQIPEISGLDSFQSHVSDRFHVLSVANPDDFLSISWINMLLDTFIDCQEEFRIMLSENRGLLSKPPADTLASEYLDRVVKGMDILNATRDGIDTIRHLWQDHMEIVVSALSNSPQKMVRKPHFLRAKKALMNLAVLVADYDKKKPIWRVSQDWSASMQLQSLADNIVLPETHQVSVAKGLDALIFSMSFILMFVLWVLVTAIPCQDRALVESPFMIPQEFPWSDPLTLIQTRIEDESKKRGLHRSSGLLREIYQMEKCMHEFIYLFDGIEFPLLEKVKNKLREHVQQLSLLCDSCKIRLKLLEQKLWEAFKKAGHCRMEGLKFT